MFRNKKVGSSSMRSLSELTPIISAAELLKEPKRKQLLDKIRELSALEESRFDSICSILIEHIINHCQQLPDSSHAYYTLPGGFLDYALNRTEAALSLFREYVLKEGEEISEAQKLWIYALLSAGMLQGIGKLQIDFHVDLYDTNGQLLKTWSPLLENISSIGNYYYYEFTKEGEVDFRRRLNILLARFLMPNSGYAWIVSEAEVLMVWLALLNEDLYSAGILGAILIRADAIAIQRYFNENLIKGLGGRGSRPGRISTFIDTNPESLLEKEQMVGIDFIKWLNEKLANGFFMINRAPLLSVPGGLLMSVDIFKLFVREHPEFKNWQAAQAGFLALGLHQNNPNGDVISKANFKDKVESGILFEKYAIALPEQVKVQQLNTGEIKNYTATQVILATEFNKFNFNTSQAPVFINANQLNAAGKWVNNQSDGNTITNSMRNDKGV